MHGQQNIKTPVNVVVGIVIRLSDSVQYVDLGQYGVVMTVCWFGTVWSGDDCLLVWESMEW